MNSDAIVYIPGQQDEQSSTYTFDHLIASTITTTYAPANRPTPFSATLEPTQTSTTAAPVSILTSTIAAPTLRADPHLFS